MQPKCLVRDGTDWGLPESCVNIGGLRLARLLCLPLHPTKRLTPSRSGRTPVVAGDS